jgi:hypothetical protein
VLRRRFFGTLTLLVSALTAATVGVVSATTVPAWQQFVHLPGIFDLAGPRSDGRIVSAVHGRLVLITPTGVVSDFAPAYSVQDGPESYIALSAGVAVDGAGCGFEKDEVLALDLRATPPGITRISSKGVLSPLARVPGVATLSGIALDTVGQFGHRLLVVGPSQTGKTRLTAIDCRGTATTIGTVDAPLEGGIAVAPMSFGSYGGQLIAADEIGGSIYAVSPSGRLSKIATPSLPAGQDIGVESAGFVPTAAPLAAYLADRATPGNPHPGTDSLLRLSGADLSTQGIRGGDLLVGTEGGATVVDVRCSGGSCTSRVTATGPSVAHAEGRLLIVAGKASSGRSVTWTVAVIVVVVIVALLFVLWRRRFRARRAQPES